MNTLTTSHGAAPDDSATAAGALEQLRDKLRPGVRVLMIDNYD